MEAADWFDLMTAAMANTASFYAVFWTVVSGYLIVGYVVGSKLSRSQLVLVNFLFIVSSSITSFAAVTACRNGLFAYRKGASSIEGMTALSAESATVFLVIIVVVNFIAIVACLKFMWDIRHPQSD